MYKRQDDDVIVLAGKDKGKRGVIKGRVTGEYVVVDGVNVVKKTTKPNPMTGEAGGIVDKAMPIHVSNIALFNRETSKADRAGFKVVDGKKVRVYKSTGEVVKG